MSAASFGAVAPNKLAVVTGGASGIGLAAARAFAAAQMRVCVIDRAGRALDAAPAAAKSIIPFVADVADARAVDAVARRIVDEHGPVSVLMNNAGIGAGGDVFADRVVWADVLAVNLMGVLHGVQSFVPAMLASGEPGLVINTGSKQGITQPPGNTAYNASAKQA
jgi:NAD(P)-dependent dehydrogenase (short-subunit alcohol dehydrogenase family)